MGPTTLAPSTAIDPSVWGGGRHFDPPPSVWWTQAIFDKVQLLVDEEATKFRPIPRTDMWDYLRLPSATWLTRRHSLRVQRLHPEHRSTPEDIRALEYFRVTVGWHLDLGHNNLWKEAHFRRRRLAKRRLAEHQRTLVRLQRFLAQRARCWMRVQQKPQGECVKRRASPRSSKN